MEILITCQEKKSTKKKFFFIWLNMCNIYIYIYIIRIFYGNPDWYLNDNIFIHYLHKMPQFPKIFFKSYFHIFLQFLKSISISLLHVKIWNSKKQLFKYCFAISAEKIKTSILLLRYEERDWDFQQYHYNTLRGKWYSRHLKNRSFTFLFSPYTENICLWKHKI